MQVWRKKYSDIKMPEPMQYEHQPVLLGQSVEALITDPEGVYVDVTFGGGGHSAEILNRLSPGGKLFAFDRDPVVEANLISDPRLVLIRSDFRFMQKYLRYYGISQVDGILADLGVSSHHFDEAERGFSFQSDAPLDMRMNPEQELTADQILQQYSEEKLKKVLAEYGEITNAGPLAERWVRERKAVRIRTCAAFADWLSPFVYGKRQRYLAQVFQALRIEVNGELESLKMLLEQSGHIIRKGGRLVVISYHSLEDRIVKNFLKGVSEVESAENPFGTAQKLFKQLNKEVMIPGEEETEMNSRSRSAKMRVGEKRIG